MRTSLRHRRGNYTMLLAVALLVVLGFGALALDVSYMLMARGQAQDVADAASQAAIVVLRQTGDRDAALDAAERIVSWNQVAGRPPDLLDVDFGTWDDNAEVPSFASGALRPNAVRVTVWETPTSFATYRK